MEKPWETTRPPPGRYGVGAKPRAEAGHLMMQTANEPAGQDRQMSRVSCSRLPEHPSPGSPPASLPTLRASTQSSGVLDSWF